MTHDASEGHESPENEYPKEAARLGEQIEHVDENAPCDEAGSRPMSMAESLRRHDRAVLDALRATNTHPTAAQLYDAVRARFPRIGQATVYRALTRLLAAGLAVDVGRDALGRHYDARVDRHDHAICTGCGRVFDLPEMSQSLPPEVLADLTAAARRAGVRVTTYEVRLHGICSACDLQAGEDSSSPREDSGGRKNAD